MNTVAICIVANGNFAGVQACIENIIARTSMEGYFCFYIIDNASGDSRISEYCQSVCDKYAKNKDKKYFFKETEKMNVHFAYNILFREAEEDLICVLPTDVIVNDNWLVDMIHSLDAIQSSGIVSIRNFTEKATITSFLASNDKMLPSWVCDDKTVRGVLLFDKMKMRVFGGYNSQLFGSGYEQDELCYRFSANGMNNFYVFGQNCIKIHEEPIKTAEGKILYEKVLAEMKKNKTYKTSL